MHIGFHHQYKGLHLGNGAFDILRVNFRFFPNTFDEYRYFCVTIIGLGVSIGKKM